MGKKKQKSKTKGRNLSRQKSNAKKNKMRANSVTEEPVETSPPISPASVVPGNEDITAGKNMPRAPLNDSPKQTKEKVVVVEAVREPKPAKTPEPVAEPQPVVALEVEPQLEVEPAAENEVEPVSVPDAAVPKEPVAVPKTVEVPVSLDGSPIDANKNLFLSEPMVAEARESQNKCDCNSCVIL